MLCLVGPGGSGKSTFMSYLLRDFAGTVARPVSTVSRAPRPGEIDGQSYHFVSRADFEAWAAQGKFFEWEEVHGNLYGRLQSTIDKALEGSSDLVVDIDIRGALNYKKRLPLNTVICFLVPPSAQALRERMLKRGGVDENEVQVRLKTAQREYDKVLSVMSDPSAVDYVVVNDQEAVAYAQVRAIFEAERARIGRIKPDALRRLCMI